MNKEGNVKVLLLNCNSDVVKLKNQDIKIYDMTNPLKGSDITENDIVFLLYDNTKELQNDFDISEFKNRTLTIGIIIEDQEKVNQNGIKRITNLIDCYVIESKEDINNISNIIEALTSSVFVDGILNLDLEDVKSSLVNAGKVGIETATVLTENRLDVVNQIIENMGEILSNSNKLIIHIFADNHLTLYEIEDIVEAIRNKAKKDATVIFSSSIVNEVEIYTKVTVIAVV